MNVGVYVHLNLDPKPGIVCDDTEPQDGHPYPTLQISGVTFFPTTAQLVTIRDTISQYLADHAATQNPALDPGGREGEFIVPCQGEPLGVGAATS